MYHMFKSGVRQKFLSFSKMNMKNFSRIVVNTNIKDFNNEYIELRSDVKTLPTQRMRESVIDAVFGDEALEEDPTVKKLCQFMCDLLGKEKAVLAPSGTMANMIALGTLSPGKKFIIQGERSHIHKAELGCQKFIGFKQITTPLVEDIQNFNIKNIVKSYMKEKNLSMDTDDFMQQVDVIAFENTHNYNGGKIMNMNNFNNIVLPEIRNIKNNGHVRLHLDGSRILNAAACTNSDPKKLCEPFDTVNVCFSKSVGAPLGSMLLMKEKDYQRAREVKTFLGGTMRQAGFMAAPALVALEDWRERLLNDHQNAILLYEGLKDIKGLIVVAPESNILNVFIDEKVFPKTKLKELLNVLYKQHKLLAYSFDGDQYIRCVVHYQVTKAHIDRAIEAFSNSVKQFY